MKTSFSLLTINLRPLLLNAFILLLMLMFPLLGMSHIDALADHNLKGKEPKKEPVENTVNLDVKKKRKLVINKSFPIVHVEKRYVFKTSGFSEEALALRSRKM